MNKRKCGLERDRRNREVKRSSLAAAEVKTIDYSHKPLAVVGIGCRLPGGITTPEEYWELLCAGRDAISMVPKSRWDWRRYYHNDPEAAGKMYVRHGGFLQQDITEFDADFFGMSPREAATIDPQQRLLLETSWEAIEDAGIPAGAIAGSRTGVYIGAFTLDNLLTQLGGGNRQQIGTHSATGSTMTILSNRLSYFFDLRGPSLSVDTACSSSLVAFHLACQGIWNNDCDMALVGGVNVIFRPEYMIAMCKGQFLSPDGRSKSFDARANGYGRGEGAGVVLVRSLETALAEGNQIYALVRGTGSNQDGRTNGITVPNPDAQKALIKTVLNQAGVDAAQVRYVEAHGTGTLVGDPIEARAIGEIFGQDRREDQRLPLGSVKANIGHLEAASGIAGLIKLCLCFRHRAIPPLANLEQPNPAIPFEQWGIRLPTSMETLDNHRPVFLAINSFGYGGTNAHVLMESPPTTRRRATRRAVRIGGLLLVSARSEPALRALVTSYRNLLAAQPDHVDEICAAAAVERTALDHRVSFSGAEVGKLLTAMDEWLGRSDASDHRVKLPDADAARPVLVFSGMGPQWWGMGQQLRAYEPIFARFVERADEIFQAISGWSILAEMSKDKASSEIKRTIYAQPANFMLQAGLLELLRAWGVKPAAAIGHSVGEVSAAYASGVLSLEDALSVSFHRSQIQAQAAGLGGMLAVGLSEDEAQGLIAQYAGRVEIAAINAPHAVTLAGDNPLLQEIASRMEVKAVFSRLLQVEVAYHSFFMEPLMQPLIDALSGLKPNYPAFKLYSTVTGQSVNEVLYDAVYWARNIREPARFMQAVDAALADGHRLFLEVGPHPVLGTSLRECLSRRKITGHVLATLQKEKDEQAALRTALGGLYEAGCELDWVSINGRPTHRVSLPRYPWQRERHWGETESSMKDRLGPTEIEILAGLRIDSHEPVWERQINRQYFPEYSDHVIQGVVLLPGAAFVDTALGVAAEMYSDAATTEIEDMVFRQPLILESDADVIMRTVLNPTSRDIVMYSRSGLNSDRWTRHVSARLSRRRLAAPLTLDVARLKQELGPESDVDAFYLRLRGLGLQYGPAFRRVQKVYSRNHHVLAQIALDDEMEMEENKIRHLLSPLLLDGAFQSLLAIVGEVQGTGLVPASIRRIAVIGEIPSTIYCFGSIVERSKDHVIGDLQIANENGQVVALVEGLRCVAIGAADTRVGERVDRLLCAPVWSPDPGVERSVRVGDWLILVERLDAGQFAELLAARLRMGGCQTVRTLVTPSAQRAGSSIDIRTEEEWSIILKDVEVNALAGIAYVCDSSPDPEPTLACNRVEILRGLFSNFSADLVGPRFYLVTHEAVAATGSDKVSGFMQAAAIGFVRVAFNEYPGLKCSLIDYDNPSETVNYVAGELLADDEADTVAWRGNQRYTQRMDATISRDSLKAAALVKEMASAPDCVHFALVSSNASRSGTQSSQLYWKTAAIAPLADDAIEVEIDFIRSTDESGTPSGGAASWARSGWYEWAGRVSRVGPSVCHWRPGDPLAGASICEPASHLVFREEALRAVRLDRAPEPSDALVGITWASAKTVLDLTHILPNESLLIVRGKTGGPAAFLAQQARQSGLIVVEAMLAADGVWPDAAPVIDLLDADAPTSLLSANSGRPFDVVVFCDTATAEAGYEIPLAECGRIMLWGAAIETFSLATCKIGTPNYSVHHIAPLALLASNVARHRNAMTTGPIRDGLFCRHGSLDELKSMPPDADLSDWVMDLRNHPAVAPADFGVFYRRPADACIITGGFGGLGMELATHLVDLGARHLVLIGRSGPSGIAAQNRIAQWRQGGVNVDEVLLDVTNFSDVDALFDLLSRKGRISSVFHAAGVLDDVPIVDMDAKRLRKVMYPKVLGAWNLHQASEAHGQRLDHFVLFSSGVTFVGNSRQANYVAANAFLDALAEYRQACGLAATSIQWGAITDVGMVTTRPEMARHFELMGIQPMSVRNTFEAMDEVLRYRPTVIDIMDVDWVKWGCYEPTAGRSLRFAHLTGKGADTVNQSVAAKLRDLPENERCEIVEIMLSEQLANTLRLPAERIDTTRPINDMGIDSLMAIEFQTAISSAFGVEFSVLEVLRGVSLREMSETVLERMSLGAASNASRPARTALTPAVAEGSRSTQELTLAAVNH